MGVFLQLCFSQVYPSYSILIVFSFIVLFGVLGLGSSIRILGLLGPVVWGFVGFLGLRLFI